MFIELLIAFLLLLTLWIYPHAEPIYLGMLVLFNLLIYLFYLYIRESLAMYASKYFTENPHALDDIIDAAASYDKQWTKDHVELMRNKVYPFDHIVYCNRFRIMDCFTTY